MHLLKQLRYFFYIAINWNLRIAIHILVQEIKGEKKYGIDTSGVDELESLEAKGIDIRHATLYMPVSYDLLEILLAQTLSNNQQKINHFLDIGCGKGRAICVAASMGIKKITGIDFSKALCLSAENNCKWVMEKNIPYTYKIIHNDAFYFEIEADVDCIFMFNPFDEIIMSGVAANILQSFEEQPRKITLIYVNPVHIETLEGIGFTTSYKVKKLKYLEAVVMELKP